MIVCPAQVYRVQPCFSLLVCYLEIYIHQSNMVKFSLKFDYLYAYTYGLRSTPDSNTIKEIDALWFYVH